MSLPKIRDAEAADAERLLEIYDYYVKNTAITFEYDTPSLAEFTARMEKTMKRYPYLVVEKDGRIMGYAYAGIFKDRAAYDWSCETTIYLDPEERKNGLGRLLYEALEERLKAMGIRNLYACIGYPEEEDEYLTKNSAEFHEHLGYTKVGEFHRCGCKFGRWYHMIWMEKLLETGGVPHEPYDWKETKKMVIEKNYRDNAALRESFNKLAEKVFGLSFENWYQNGFWKDNYIPYSAVIDGEVVANVSVNACSMNYKGEVVKLFQLGTIMTDPGYRGRGYARLLMEEVLKDFEGKADGIYLYANDTVLDFYPRFGFRKAKEYQYTKETAFAGEDKTVRIPMKDKKDFDRMAAILSERRQNAQMYMVGNTGLYMFYLSQFMTENVFYIAGCDSYVVAEKEDDTLILHAIIGDGPVDEVIEAFGASIRKTVLCFTPKDPRGFEKNELHEEDTTFFVKGRFFDEHSKDEFMMPSITHA